MRVAHNVLEIIGQRIELRNSGKEYVGRRPFHEDKTPSFGVNQEKGAFLLSLLP